MLHNKKVNIGVEMPENGMWKLEYLGVKAPKKQKKQKTTTTTELSHWWKWSFLPQFYWLLGGYILFLIIVWQKNIEHQILAYAKEQKHEIVRSC
jgi:hypothetical protein